MEHLSKLFVILEVRSSEGKRVSCLWEQFLQFCHSEPSYCQAEADTIKVSVEESPRIKSGILRAKNNCHPQNDVTANEPLIQTFSCLEKELEIQSGTCHSEALAEESLYTKFCMRFFALRCHSSTLFAGQRKFAFTLAEVLITLGIIGIVAAMTLPALVQSHKEKTNCTHLKKVYSTLSNAFLLAYNDFGSLENWGVVYMNGSDESLAASNAFKNKFISNLKPYLKIIKFCEFGNTSCESSPYSVVSLDGTSHTVGGVKFSPHVVLADGTTINHLWFSNSSPVYGEIYIDLNGIKPPNKIGEDIFVFGVKENKLFPYGTDKSDWNPGFSFDRLCKLSTTSRMNGYGCAAWVIFNENMDYLHCNDLSWNGKKKCR